MSCFLWILLLLDAAYGGRTRARTWDPLIKSQLLFSMIDVTRVITGCRAKHDRTISQLLPIVWIRQFMDDVDPRSLGSDWDHPPDLRSGGMQQLLPPCRLRFKLSGICSNPRESGIWRPAHQDERHDRRDAEKLADVGAHIIFATACCAVETGRSPFSGDSPRSGMSLCAY